MGLKQMVETAMQDIENAANDKPKRTARISGAAHKGYADAIRRWSGWPTASLVFGEVPDGAFAMVHPPTKEFTADPEALLLNPNKVMLSANPYRMRQEAVLTGALLHEVGHARHTKWRPRTDRARAALRHSDGTEVADSTIAWARVMEEARVEGLIAGEATVIGASNLAWTMRAAAAHLLPPTELSDDPDKAIVEIIVSWVLRAGRQRAVASNVAGHTMPKWVNDFDELMHKAVVDHLTRISGDASDSQGVANALIIRNLIHTMISGKTDGGNFATSSDEGWYMIDAAREMQQLLFPETPPEDQPSPGDSCANEGTSGDGESEGSGTDTTSAKAMALASMEQQVEVADENEAKQEKAKPPSTGGTQGGVGQAASGKGQWRDPSRAEREVQRGAERFLRTIIDPAERSTVVLTDQPSATVDGAELAAWKAGGQVREPHFFRRTRRDVLPTPPVKIAVLVDISASMSVLQKPSALLSWALSTACIDLRNFAGRGVQVESTLIHWGDDAKVIQRNGDFLPGIREVSCHHGTSAMHSALALVDEQMPGFFDPGDRAENRLLVQFTDWHLNHRTYQESLPTLLTGLNSGMNMLSVMPARYGSTHSHLDSLMAAGGSEARGKSMRLGYDSDTDPALVWTSAAEVLS